MPKTGSTYTYPSLLDIREVDKADALLRQLVSPNVEQTKCACFGCGRTLTLEERLCGNRCKDHQKTSEVDVTKFVSY